MATLPLDTSRMGTFVLESVEPITDYTTGEPVKNEQGIPRYNLVCRYFEDEQARPEEIKVKMYLDRLPNVRRYTEVSFQGLEARYWTTHNENGQSRSGVSFTAEKVGTPPKQANE